MKELYLVWFGYYKILPKAHRFSLGQKIDLLFTDTIEAIAVATFLNKEDKLPYVRLALRKTDTLKVFMLILWESKSLDNKKYLVLSEKLEEIGKMLGGWHNQLIKQNSPAIKAREK